MPFGGELGKVRDSATVPNFGKQGEAVGQVRGRKPKEGQEVEVKKPEPKKKSRRGGVNEQEPAVESKPKRRRTGSQKKQAPEETI